MQGGGFRRSVYANLKVMYFIIFIMVLYLVSSAVSLKKLEEKFHNCFELNMCKYFKKEFTLIVYIKTAPLERKIAEKNITETDFCCRIGIDPTHFSRMKYPESYKIGVSPRVRAKMMKFLGCKFDEIFHVNQSWRAKK